MKGLTQVVAIIFLLMLLQLGCTDEVPLQMEEQKQIDSDIVKSEAEIQALNEQIHQLNKQVESLNKEKEAFLIADRFGRELYQAMIYADVEKLNDMTTSNLEVFADRFEKQVGEETVETPFKGLQHERHRNNKVILKTNGFGFLDDQQTIGIHYMIIDSENASAYFLNVLLVQTGTLDWLVDEVYFDI